MSFNDSNLSSPKYGYDFVLSTTQASINSGLLEYLSQEGQPIAYICFLADKNTGNPTQQIALDDLLIQTKGVNPFDIPDGTAWNDPRIQVLTKALFVCGVKIQMGLPPGVLPKDLPEPVVVLGNSANNVRFNMYCSQFSVIQNTPPSGFGGTGVWNVWSQRPGFPWYVDTTVDLITEDLDSELNTPYFNNHPKEKAALLAQLTNLSSTAFSLQQLLFDLDNAVLQSVPTFEGIPAGSNAEAILQKSFVSIYSTNAKQYGQPLLSVNAVAQQTPDPSQLHLTGIERQVSTLVDESSGVPIQNPTPVQQSATTLNYLCAVNHNPLPGAASFSWNWVEPTNIESESGVIAINRNTIANYFMKELQLLPSVRNSCVAVTTSVKAHWWGPVTYYHTFVPGQSLQSAAISESGADVISMAYESASDNSDSQGATSGELKIQSNYNCDVNFSGNAITVTQHLVFYLYARWDSTSDHLNIFDKTLTDVYNLTVNDNGVLQTQSPPTSSTRDDSESPDRSSIVNFFTGINDLINDIKGNVTDFANTSIRAIDLSGPQSFIFPGAKVFTFSSPIFSKNQDLLCSISYVKTTLDQVPQSRFVRPKRLRAILPRSKIATDPLLQTNGITTPIPTPAKSANTVPSRDTVPKITYSSQMMQNYLQGEIVSAQAKFEAVQTSDGHALLFATDSNGILNGIEEQNGKTSTGWILNDLSTAFNKAKFPGATVRTFDTGQSALDGSISLGMAVSSGGSDHLCVSLANSNEVGTWITETQWTLYPFDAPGEMLAGITIAGILFSETLDHQQYLIVDIDRSTISSVKDIARYYIDPSKSQGSYWMPHNVPVDIEDGSYQSCIGRAGGESVDGVYTLGMAGKSGQLVYVPIINIFGDGPPLPTRLGLPGDEPASAIAGARNLNEASDLYGTTDLYAIGGSTLYRFAAEEQKADNDLGRPLATNSLFAGTQKLMAMIHDGVTTLWGRNGSDDVYYLSCPSDHVSESGSWSTPVPIVYGIERVSAYVNRQDGGNTIFASGGGNLQKLIQATSTSSQMWLAQEIKLAAPLMEKSLSFNSYTTTISLADADNLPVREAELAISAKSRTPVYINGIYYVLGQTPVSVATDSTGSVTVIEAADDINGTVLMVSTSASESITINPMDEPFKKLASLDSKDALRGATFPKGIVAGGVLGPTESVHLVSSSVSDDDASAVADNMGKLKTIYNGLDSPPKAQKAESPTNRGSHGLRALAASDILDTDIAISAGDLFRWLKSGVDAAIRLVEDAVSGSWRFFATIGGKVYRTVLDTAEAVVGAAQWVFDEIETAIEDVIHFLEFLFEWDDIRRTKDVMHNITNLFLQDMVSDMTKVQNAFDGQIANVEETVNQWAGIKDWSLLGAPATSLASSSTSNPAGSQTSGSQLLSNHFRDQAGQITVLSGSPSMSVVQELIEDLLTAISKEGSILSTVYDQLAQLARDFASLDVGSMIRRIAGILANGVLSSAQVVVDALLNVLKDLAATAIGILDAKIHIPVISDILNLLGIADISFLDLFTWIAAVSYTVIYKIANDEAPFPNNNDTSSVISASDWDGLSVLFQTLPNPSATSLKAAAVHHETLNRQALTLSSALQSAVFVAGHATAGFIALTGDFVTSFEASEETGQNQWSIPSAVMGAIFAASADAADALAPKYPIENQPVSVFMKANTTAVVLAKLVFSGPAQEKFRAQESSFSGLAVQDGRATGAIVNAILIIPALFGTCWHFYELSEKPASAERSAAIIGEVSKLSTYMSRVSYAMAVNDTNPESKAIEVGAMAAINLTVAGLQTAEAIAA